MEYADGDRYEGEWKDEKKHGYGKYTYADGRVREGMWHEGKEVNYDGQGNAVLLAVPKGKMKASGADAYGMKPWSPISEIKLMK